MGCTAAVCARRRYAPKVPIQEITIVRQVGIWSEFRQPITVCNMRTQSNGMANAIVKSDCAKVFCTIRLSVPSYRSVFSVLITFAGSRWFLLPVECITVAGMMNQPLLLFFAGFFEMNTGGGAAGRARLYAVLGGCNQYLRISFAIRLV